MSNTFSQVYIQCVFAVKFRAALLNKNWDQRLRSYISAIIQDNGHKVLAINNMPDHLHVFFGLNPTQSISSLMQIVKGESSEWINREKLCSQKFQWQTGYAAFSYAKSEISTVVSYIQNQQEHHKKIPFLDEYKIMLETAGIEYNPKYIFQPPVD